MLYHRDHQWLRRNGASLFNAHIKPATRRREDVFWCLEMQWFAAGPIWRRVAWTRRPWLWLIFYGFQAPTSSWTGLEQLDFWNLPDEAELEDWWGRGAGFLDVDYWPHQGTREWDRTSLTGGHIWRVAAREGRWFTVELAVLADGSDALEELENLPVLVTPGGVEERAEFRGGSVIVPRRHHADPAGWAREALRTEVGCEAMHEIKVKWALRQTADRTEIVPMPGWGGTVGFRTEPWPIREAPAPPESAMGA